MVNNGTTQQLLMPPKPNGTSLYLAKQDPNTSPQFGVDSHLKASLRMEEGVGEFWNVPSTVFTYAVGRYPGEKGYTSQLHLYASGGKQLFDWKTQHGYLSSPSDLHDQDFTVYIHVTDLLTPEIALISLKICGGQHAARANLTDLSLCVMMTVGPNTNQSYFAKELAHPNYDFVLLEPKFLFALPENQWTGLKYQSYSNPSIATQLINRLYINQAPFDFYHSSWQLYTENVDEEGKSTGQYDKLVDWGGWQATLRADGYQSMDFTQVSSAYRYEISGSVK
jgi:hypothetical protein